MTSDQVPFDQQTADPGRRSLYDDGAAGIHNRQYSGSMQRRESSLRDAWSESGDSDALLVSPRKDLPSNLGRTGHAI
jgi:hypothetical protein